MLWVEMDLFSAGAWRWLQLWLSGARLISDGHLPLRRRGDSVCVSGAESRRFQVQVLGSSLFVLP